MLHEPEEQTPGAEEAQAEVRASFPAISLMRLALGELRSSRDDLHLSREARLYPEPPPYECGRHKHLVYWTVPFLLIRSRNQTLRQQIQLQALPMVSEPSLSPLLVECILGLAGVGVGWS